MNRQTKLLRTLLKDNIIDQQKDTTARVRKLEARGTSRAVDPVITGDDIANQWVEYITIRGRKFAIFVTPSEASDQ